MLAPGLPISRTTSILRAEAQKPICLIGGEGLWSARGLVRTGPRTTLQRKYPVSGAIFRDEYDQSVCSEIYRPHTCLENPDICERCGSFQRKHFCHFSKTTYLKYGDCVMIKIKNQYNFTPNGSFRKVNLHRCYGRVTLIDNEDNIHVWIKKYNQTFTFNRSNLRAVKDDEYLRSGATFDDIVGPRPVIMTKHGHSPESDQGIPRYTMIVLHSLRTIPTFKFNGQLGYIWQPYLPKYNIYSVRLFNDETSFYAVHPYGQRFSGKFWNEDFSEWLVKQGFLQSPADTTYFMK